MKIFAATVLSLSMGFTGAFASAQAPGITVTTAGAKPSVPGATTNFTGAVHIDGLFQAAAPATGMTHIAIAEAQDGKAVTWQEKVSDAQYQASIQP
jgi:hypothetical protein